MLFSESNKGMQIKGSYGRFLSGLKTIYVITLTSITYVYFVMIANTNRQKRQPW